MLPVHYRNKAQRKRFWYAGGYDGTVVHVHRINSRLPCGRQGTGSAHRALASRPRKVASCTCRCAVSGDPRADGPPGARGRGCCTGSTPRQAVSCSSPAIAVLHARSDRRSANSGFIKHYRRVGERFSSTRDFAFRSVAKRHHSKAVQAFGEGRKSVRPVSATSPPHPGKRGPSVPTGRRS